MIVDGLAVFHVVAKVEVQELSLCEFEVGSWFWDRLRAVFPLALAACLMPDHPHVVTPLEDPDEARRRLNRLFGHLARRVGVRFVGETAEPAPVRDKAKLLRELRYVGLNPARAGLTDDPLAWLFSTHRDIVGASADPWIDAGRLARALGRPEAGLVEWYHRYVSADPSVRVDGTPLPRPARATDLPLVPLGRIARAAAAATRSRPEAIRTSSATRRLFVALAREQGWVRTDLLARACACDQSTIRRISSVDVAPARLCLGDRRLLHGVPRFTPSDRTQTRQVDGLKGSRVEIAGRKGRLRA